ncbi:MULTISPECIES: DNA mismatch repair protein MutS [Micromonospora]|uniref:DNA mismatch repair protein MutS n=1 Tax=Micromonospora solifontis TaxID=2487138 RepID=A0ABX9WFK7_9ACTN|nr:MULTISPECIES: DNA mismatch repair protein MutS [Micromonospora]NES16997.1 DNA mismatch repair protein MutS [Micromonospora sp. PPF5-17B]NES38410.1 DNA mismatch repair protein MutS [Micromonospora solifontis]NES58722.1 DNA mismatch repair protein MutS [Micromonospora sp. PPF5-6]RNL95825.1 DNA mismatch repair protein MutS [Micromonospora solifontis]
MKVALMHRKPEFEPAPLPPTADHVIRDLHLPVLFEAMSRGDTVVAETVPPAVLSGLTEIEDITYRQEVLADCLRHPDVIRGLYAVASEAVEGRRRDVLGYLHPTPHLVLHDAVRAVADFVTKLRQVRRLADRHAHTFRSDGFTAFFARLADELDDDYLDRIEAYTRELDFPRGVLLDARLGAGARGVDLVLRRSGEQPGWWERLTGGGPETYTWRLPERDEAGAQALGDLRDRGIAAAATALAESADHIRGFFTALRTELAFYVGCLNLYEDLRAKGEPVCWPTPLPTGGPGLVAEGLYDPALSLRLGDGRAVGNDIDAAGAGLVVITGANQGGKSTLLRGLGVAWLMAGCGMFAPARSLRIAVGTGVFTHFRREEDAGMDSGKLDEELTRMAQIAAQLREGGVVLLNESFAATNEREGAEIGQQIIRALVDRGVQVVCVTHLYELAHGLAQDPPGRALFLRAERRDDGRRTFVLRPGAPEPTSHGVDLYRRIFGAAPGAATS